jgi:hypothetical protein
VSDLNGHYAFTDLALSPLPSAPLRVVERPPEGWRPTTGTTAVGATSELVGTRSVSFTQVHPIAEAIDFANLRVADAGADRRSDEGMAVLFAATVIDPDPANGSTIDLAWVALDPTGTPVEADGGPAFSFTPVDDGTYRVQLSATVLDQEGERTYRDTVFVVVGNVAPTLDAGSDVVLFEGDELTRSLIFADPGADSWTAGIDWGDGTAGEELGLTERTLPLDHVYAVPGEFAVRVTLMDDEGAVAIDDFLVTVSPKPPQVAEVVVRGTAWSPAFLDFLAAQGLGEGGYRIPAGSASQADELPWINLDQIAIVFTEDVVVRIDDLELLGVNVASYGVSAFEYDPIEQRATWTLAQPLGSSLLPDKILLRLSDAVRDGTGNALDGEWSDQDSPYPSGDGVAGGDFLFRLNVVPGDVSRNGGVNIQDTIQTRNRQGSSSSQPANYSIFHDVNANGGINAQDTILVRNRQGTSLPAGEPVAGGELFASSTTAFVALAQEEVGAESVMAASRADLTSASEPSMEGIRVLLDTELRLGEDVVLEPGVQIEPGVELGDRVRVRKGARIGAETSIGADSVVGQGATVGRGARLGRGVFVAPGAEIPDDAVVLDRSVVLARANSDRPGPLAPAGFVSGWERLRPWRRDQSSAGWSGE